MISYIKAIKMKFCPKCETRTANKEYEVCPLCGVRLIDNEKSIQKAKEQLKQINELENEKTSALVESSVVEAEELA
ncbi:hypothetical protein CDQ75_08665 [Campylobacter hyointestinalis subsp. hyointestinalis]|uniref:Uncharacterized protein n=2 Tax=Campylobacter hyointestinalis TaxID=198 RepID=A0A9W5AX96_CAMHY|nr:hypothetical protein CDQ75_08665 [Campylobacter hyointestinalis subsp. hyointestinalis]CUU92468.1 Uncharacterised protein [Campylobacter hyointestinalis subsp. hyointestinalis]